LTFAFCWCNFDNPTQRWLNANISATNVKKKIKFGFLTAFLITSCGVYNPQTVDIPLISKKKDLRIDAGISMATLNATVSYGLTNKIALQTFGSIRGENEHHFQGAAGYFRDLGDLKVLEFYGGFGFGYGDAYNDANPGNLYGNYQYYFAQFNFGKLDCKFANTDIGFGVKGGYIHSDLIDDNYYARGSMTPSSGTYIDNSITFEPQIFVRLGGEKLKFSVKLAGCFLHKYTNTDKWFPYDKVNLGLGLNYRF
jgi:hypothetical protein